MRHDLETLQKIVETAIEQSLAAGVVEAVRLDPAAIDIEEDTLRIMVSVRTLERVEKTALLDLMHRVGRAVNSIDERSASVRFSEAA